MRNRFYAAGLVLLCLLPALHKGVLAAGNETTAQRWITLGPDGSTRVPLYFFWSRSCPHCTRARPFVNELAVELPWLDLHAFELTAERTHVQRFIELARATDSSVSSVPAFFFCGIQLTGFDDEHGMGAFLREQLSECYRQNQQTTSTDSTLIPGSTPVHLPIVGTIDPAQWSLPLLTVTLAALDSFNPCAFFVLLFLLSLLIHTRDRRKMLLIGGLFVSVSGLVYFLFMSAWLNIFLVSGQLPWITLLAGVFAIMIALLNIKDFFWFHRGPSLSIPDSAKPKLYQRVRALVTMERLPAMIGGTLLLALVANAYELLCTAGFPMVFTRILTLSQVAQTSYYSYLALYCLIYVLPLLAIVMVFVVTLGRFKLQERHGRALKLVSGVMMLALGLVLVIAPQQLSNPLIGIGLIAGALVVSLIVGKIGAHPPL